MTTIGQTDNDNLLVLSDNNEVDNISITDNTENTGSEDIILFDTDSSLDIKIDEKNDDLKVEDDVFGFGTENNDLIETKSNIVSDSNLSTDNNFDLGIVEKEIKTDNTTASDLNTSTDNNNEKNTDLGINKEESKIIGSMSDILDETINKFSSRGNVIKTEKDIEKIHISELKEQRSNIDAQITIGEEKVSELNSEEALIAKNTKSLERMKSVNNTDSVKAEISTKVHNAKRKAA